MKLFCAAEVNIERNGLFIPLTSGKTIFFSILSRFCFQHSLIKIIQFPTQELKKVDIFFTKRNFKKGKEISL